MKIYNESLANMYPELAAQWHPTLNGNLKPENVSYGSNVKVWWLCKNGHTYKMSLNHAAKVVFAIYVQRKNLRKN